MAISGAANLVTAETMIAAGLGVDFVRAVSWRGRYTLDYWLRRIQRNLSDPACYRARRRSPLRIAYSPVVIFLVNGIFWVVLARPERWEASPIVGYLHVDSNAIVAISHIARQYIAELVAHGYPRRAELVDDFVLQSFLIYVVCMLIWSFAGARYEMDDYLTKLYRKVTSTGQQPINFAPFVALCMFFFVFGFLLINNLTFIDWTGHHDREAVQSSNLFFMTFDTIMMYTYFMMGLILPYATLGCLGVTVETMQMVKAPPR